jgi:unsaturated rhamnogalacturonyl hydrolase
MKFIKILSLSLFCFVLFFSCKNAEENRGSENTLEVLISEDLNWSERMMLSEIKRFPKAWQLDFQDKPVWSYPNGLVLKGSEELYEKTDRQVYYDYILSYTDALIDSTGNIKTYKPETKNLDMLKSGHVLLYLYDTTGGEKYRKAAEQLREQFNDQQRTESGGFWHKNAILTKCG